MNQSVIAFVVVYILLMIGVGVWGSLRTKTLNDFFLGGRSFGPWVTAFAYGTTYFSAVVFVGFAGNFGWNNGLSSVWVGVANAVAGALLAWVLLGKRIRRMTQNLDVMTMPEFFYRRFDFPFLKPLAAIIIFVFLLPYSAGVYKGLGELFHAAFPAVAFNTAIFIMAAITGLYLILGGYFAVAMTDFIQGIIMLFGALALVWFVSKSGNPDGGIVSTATLAAEKFAEHKAAGLTKTGDWYILVSTICMTSFGCWALPQMTHKFYAIKDEKMIMRGAIVCTIFAMVIGSAAYYTGSLSHLFFDALPEGRVDKLVPTIITTKLPPLMLGLMIVLLLSASMSTLSGLVMVSASAITIDLYKGMVDTNVSHKTSVTMMRFLCAIFIALSYFIAVNPVNIIVTLMSLSWGAVSGAFLAPFIYGLFWKRATGVGVLAGMICGMATTIVLFFILPEQFGTFSACMGMLVPFAIVPLVSLFTKPVDKGVLDKAFASGR